MWFRTLEALVLVAVATLLVAFAVELWNGPAAAMGGKARATTPSGALARE
jgi:hypothetical protein